MITKTTTSVYARAVEGGRSSRDFFRRALTGQGEQFGPESEYYGKVEIVAVTIVESLRNNATLMPGTGPERTEQVLVTLDQPGQVINLIRSLSTALADSLDVKSGASGAYPNHVVTQEQS